MILLLPCDHAPNKKAGLPPRYSALLLYLLVLLVTTGAAAPALQRKTAPGGTALASNRLTTVEWESYHEREHEGPGTYAFGYDIQDPETGNVQFREESRDADGTVRGSYGLVEPDGNVRTVHYVADHLGFRVEIENSQKPGEQHPSPGKFATPRLTHAPVLQVHQTPAQLSTGHQENK